MRNYQQLIQSTKKRLNPDDVSIQKQFLDELSSISYNDALTFVRLAMKSVEPSYTEKSKEAGERAKAHLNNELSDVEFKYQGSVMTNTHIKGYSDIDLLIICTKFYTYDSRRINEIIGSTTEKSKFFNVQIEKLINENLTSQYDGNSIVDLINIRNDSEIILQGKYNICDVSNAKSIKLTNQNLNREVDVVIANWYDDVRSIINDKGEFRGIQVFNKILVKKEMADYPFTSIERINTRSVETRGRLKKMIRFLKTVKAESEIDIKLSSFDINAICYDIKISEYENLAFHELVFIIYRQLVKISNDENYANDLISVDGREYIFRGDKSKIENICQILKEVEGIYQDLQAVSLYS